MDWNNKNEVLKAIKYNGLQLCHVNDALKNDFDVVLEAVKQNGLALQYVSKELKHNKAICLQASISDIFALRYVPEEFIKEKDFMLNVCKIDVNVLNFTPKELDEDVNFLKECIKVQKNPLDVLKHAYNRFDEEFINRISSATLDYLETTTFSLDYRMDVLKKMNIDDLYNFLIERYDEMEVESLEGINTKYDLKK